MLDFVHFIIINKERVSLKFENIYLRELGPLGLYYLGSANGNFISPKLYQLLIPFFKLIHILCMDSDVSKLHIFCILVVFKTILCKNISMGQNMQIEDQRKLCQFHWHCAKTLSLNKTKSDTM